MSTTAGYFDETLRLAIRARASELAWESRIDLQYKPEIEALKAVLANETARLTMLENPAKEDTVQIEWINACAITDQECTNCTFDFPQLSTNILEETMDLCRETGFQVNEQTARTNDFDYVDFVAKGFLRAETVLLEWFNNQLLTEINAAKGNNLLAPGTNRGCIVGAETYITAPYWNANLFSYFKRVANINRFESPYLLSGSNLYEAWLTANFNSGNDNGKGDQAMFGSMPIFFDEATIDPLFTPILYTFLINKGTIKTANKARYMGFSEQNPKVYQSGQLRYAYELRLLPGYWVDVHVTDECDTDNDQFNESFKFKFRGGIYFNPTGCDDNNTGILSFQCGECPV